MHRKISSGQRRSNPTTLDIFSQIANPPLMKYNFLHLSTIPVLIILPVDCRCLMQIRKAGSQCDFIALSTRLFLCQTIIYKGQYHVFLKVPLYNKSYTVTDSQIVIILLDKTNMNESSFSVPYRSLQRIITRNR
jgi:hypothetical protein